MFIEYLKISTPEEVIRKIPFRKGINLIVDNSSGHVTGNGVGKTTVLKLIDFCFGANPKSIYKDPESKKEINQPVRDFLVGNNVTITLCLTENLDNASAKRFIIERNFLSRKKIIRRINGNQLTEDEFDPKLIETFFPEHTASKPTFRQIISHNIRYKDISISNTLNTLDKYTTDAEYETLYLFLLGCDFTQGNHKQEVLLKIRQEDVFKKRLEKIQTKSAYETALSLIEDRIEKLNKQRDGLNINTHFESDINKLHKLKYHINILVSELNKLNMRKDLIQETKNELTSSMSNIDLKQLQLIYNQAKDNMGSIHKTFEHLVSYHNQMLDMKVSYITKELPSLLKKIDDKKTRISKLLLEETEVSDAISKSDTFEKLESIILELNEEFRKKGEYESIIQQLEEVDNNLDAYNSELQLIDNELFSTDFESIVKHQVSKFSKHFASVSDLLYGEQFALKYDIVTNRKGQRLYKFSAFNTNFSSGKKQGEISCFDIAYTFFADEENFPCLHFLLNDKKELMHDNQLVKIAELIGNSNNIQFVASILKDKLPDQLNHEEYFILELSENDKLFRIEEMSRLH